jgi:hypothetical protein
LIIAETRRRKHSRVTTMVNSEVKVTGIGSLVFAVPKVRVGKYQNH